VPEQFARSSDRALSRGCLLQNPTLCSVVTRTAPVPGRAITVRSTTQSARQLHDLSRAAALEFPSKFRCLDSNPLARHAVPACTACRAFFPIESSRRPVTDASSRRPNLQYFVLPKGRLLNSDAQAAEYSLAGASNTVAFNGLPSSSVISTCHPSLAKTRAFAIAISSLVRSQLNVSFSLAATIR
jgi:hypothetical protein